MTTIIEHVRHRVGIRLVDDPRIWMTECSRIFSPAHPVYDRRSIAHHEPATSRCANCYPDPGLQPSVGVPRG